MNPKVQGKDGVRPAICSVGELFGGVERHILELCRYLERELDVRPLLILFNEGELARKARQQGQEPLVLAGRNRYDLRLVAELAKQLARARINLVHVHGYKATIVSALAQRRHRFALVKTEHGLVEPSGGNAVVWMKSRLNLALERHFNRCVSVLCCVTDDLRRRIAKSSPRFRLLTVPNGIDPLDGTATRRPAELEQGFFHVGIVGRVAAVKGIDIALQAMRDPELPDEVKLSIIGSGPQEKLLWSRANALDLGDRVRFLGFRSEIYDYLANLDALLMPSIHEGLPYTLLEAMALETPVLAARVGGLAEVLCHEETGLLFPPGNLVAIRQAIDRVFTDRELGRRLAARALADQRRRFSLDRMGKTYWNVYQDAVKGLDRNVA